MSSNAPAPSTGLFGTLSGLFSGQKKNSPAAAPVPPATPVAPATGGRRRRNTKRRSTRRHKKSRSRRH